MRNLIVRALDRLVLVKVCRALKTEGVPTREGNGLLIIMVVRLEAHPTLKNRIDRLGH